jgi:hypothetical protein
LVKKKKQVAQVPTKVDRPLRDPDHFSKRGVPYWWAPEWTRATTSDQVSYGKIKAILTKKNDVELHMVSKEGKLTYIQGSIQEEFKKWHDDRQIDYILLGETPEDASKLIITETEDTTYEQ